MVLHYVIQVQKGVRLINQPLQLLPEIWRNFIHSLNISEVGKTPVSEKSTATSKSAKNMKMASTKLNGWVETNQPMFLKVPSVGSSQAKNLLRNCNNQKLRSSESSNAPGPSKSKDFQHLLPSAANPQSNSREISSAKFPEKKIPKKRTVKSEAPSICQAMLSRIDQVPRPVKSSLKPTVEKRENREKSPSQKTPRVRFKLKTDPPKVRFAIKYGDNDVYKSNNTSLQKNLFNGHKDDSSITESSSEDEICLQNGIDSDSWEKSKSTKTSECTENDVNKSNRVESRTRTKSPSPTRTISHSPKPPSTVKLKKSILKNKSTNRVPFLDNECSLSCPELPTNSNDF